MTCLVRPLEAADEPQWRLLWRDYLAFYETTLPDAHFTTYFQRLLRNDPHDFHGLVAEVDGSLVGLTHYLFHSHGWKDRVCYLQDLYANPDVRGQGIGRALIEAVYRAADEEGVPDVYWLTQDFNTTARHLYDRIGVATPFIKYVSSA